MNVSVRINPAKLVAQFKRFNSAQKMKILEKVTRTDAMGFVRDVVAITPPGHQGVPFKSGGGGKGAIAAGRAAIRRDLLGGKGRGGIFNVLADGLIDAAVASDTGKQNVRLFVKADGSVYGTERANFAPDATNETLHDHHKRYFKNGRMSQAGGRTRNIGRWRFMDKLTIRKSAFDSYLIYAFQKIGILAGGWAAAAVKLKVRLPKEANRHASGTADIKTTARSWRIKITNTVGYATQADMTKRANFVLESEKRKKRLKQRMKVEITAALKAMGVGK